LVAREEASQVMEALLKVLAKIRSQYKSILKVADSEVLSKVLEMLQLWGREVGSSLEARDWCSRLRGRLEQEGAGGY
jgi:hypothetical protein